MEMEMRNVKLRRSRPQSVQFAPSVNVEEARRVNLNRAKTLSVGAKVRMRPNVEKRLRRQESVMALEELVVCGICLSMIENPKMLTCQHTFCHDCLKQLLERSDEKAIVCPVCKQKSEVDNIDDLPSNIYLNNLITVLTDATETVGCAPEEKSEKIANASTKNCATCKTICAENALVKCQHCTLDYCSVCFSLHAEELTARYPDFLKQLQEHETSLTFEQTNYKRHCDRLVEEVKLGVALKIDELKKQEEEILKEVASLHEAGGMEISEISAKVGNLKDVIRNQTETRPHNKIMNYMDFHQQMSNILDTISSLAVNYKQFNIATFKLDTPASPTTPQANFLYDEIQNYQVNSPTMRLKYYKNKAFAPKSVCQKFQEPAGMCVSPWDANQLFVCSLKTIYIYDISAGKVAARIQNDNMACLHSIACNAETSEIFVSDKYKNVVHVLNKDGGYIRKLSPKNLANPYGIALTKEGDLLLCDAGHDRLIIIDATHGKIKNTIGVKDGITELSMPTDVATDGKIIAVADAGNHRVKIFDAVTLERRAEIGCLGKQKKQFQSAEVVHVDEGGFILVGDSGNKRLQIFDSDGEFVQCTKTEFKLLSVAGICTNDKADVFVTDLKNKCLIRF